MTKMDSKNKTLRMTQMGMLAAISIVLILLLRIPLFPSAPFLEYDMADVPVLIAAFVLGPIPGLIVLFVVSLIQAFLLGGNGIIGLIMHFFASGALVVVASLIYRRCGQTTVSLIIGLVVGSLCMTALMIPFNMIFIPLLFGVGQEVVKALIIPILIPFNLIKAGLNSVIFFLIFKSIRYLWQKKSIAGK